eukprot:TRINITY_DN42883_c0_g1_i1.p1 TRINITY_DN42883_c0_g1~~TRINITY_DN42883_c0_g1_i1.p1  ORF type:complete len:427 (-),score=56.01 TRINITY_DN42883_c0_g1_i1:210-1490(-)
MPGHRDISGLLRKRGYLELRKIGEGSFGKALLVQNEQDGSKLVCKMVDVSLASQKETQEAVKEGKLLAAFKHPYVVRYRDSFIESGWLCILMDFCEGGDLTQQIEQAKKSRQPIHEDQILLWLTQGLLALKYIHDKHVLHRDLKSGNFFLSKSGTLKMGDFGIAKVLDCTAACARTQIGTPYYLSPEVCQEKPYAWPADIWAMGCILFELCERKVPFDATNISGLVQKIVHGPTPVVGESYSNFTRNLCSEMLNRNPMLRPSAEAILQRPQIQDVVRRMLEERKAQEAKRVDRPSARGDAESETPTPAHQAGAGTPRPENGDGQHGPPPIRPPGSRAGSVVAEHRIGRTPSYEPPGDRGGAHVPLVRRVSRGPSPGPGGHRAHRSDMPHARLPPAPGVGVGGGARTPSPRPSRFAALGGMAIGGGM